MFFSLPRRTSLAILLPSLLTLAACSQAQPPAPAPTPAAAASAEAPKALDGLRRHGFELVGPIQAPAGLQGFAGVVGGQQPVAAYVTADGQSVIVGSLFDAEGNDLSAKVLETAVAGPLSEKTWARLQDSAWVRDGRADAPRVIYTFSDANCPYCHRFWEAARPWVDAGKVQLRHLMVGVIREDSPGKAAAILSAADPSAALLANERAFDKGGIKPTAISADVAAKLDANQVLMVEMGFQGTPGILFQDEKGHVQRRAGMPQGNDLQVVLGPR